MMGNVHHSTGNNAPVILGRSRRVWPSEEKEGGKEDQRMNIHKYAWNLERYTRSMYIAGGHIVEKCQIRASI